MKTLSIITDIVDALGDLTDVHIEYHRDDMDELERALWDKLVHQVGHVADTLAAIRSTDAHDA